MTTPLKKLKNCTTKPEFSRLLGLDPVFLTRVVYRDPSSGLYTKFPIKKKDGSDRIISSPNKNLKEIQKRLSDLLFSCLSEIRHSNNILNHISHGFEKEKSIITNAEKHIKERWVLNIDLSNFFDQFNYGRVRGYFLKNSHFNLDDNIANTIAKIACFNNKLPQGSPCSPIITNLILLSLDQRLHKLCKKLGCTYSRYADDITISTSKSTFPYKIIKDNTNKKITLHPMFIKEIVRAGFSINEKKTRLQHKTLRQEVTGLTVNEKISCNKKFSKNARAMAHSLFTKGVFTLVDKTTTEVREGTLNEIEGILGFIDSIDKYNNKIEKDKNVKFDKNKKHTLNKREQLYADFIYFKKFFANIKPVILTEGKTDITYLRTALNSLSSKYPTLISQKKTSNKNVNDYSISFFSNNGKTKYLLGLPDGSTGLKDLIHKHESRLKKYTTEISKKPVILILDNDSGSTGSNGLFSMLTGKQFPNIKLDRATLRKSKWVWITKNLYLILTPSNGETDTAIEDLFDDATLNIQLNGKKFNRTNNECGPLEYGKEYFASHVVLKKQDSIDFNNFSYIFDAILEVMDDYSKIHPTIK